MKFAAFVLVLTLVHCHAAHWNIKSPMDKPHYKEVVEELAPGLKDENKNVTLTGRITNGSPATLGQFPYQVYLYSLEIAGTYLCGGSIIHRRWVLTAAHCVYGIMKVEVHFGAINRNPSGTGSFVRRIFVTNMRSIIYHENYNDRSLINDIALLELPQDAPIENSYVGILDIPTGMDIERNLAGVQGTVSGFGRTSDKLASSNNLNYIEAPIMQNSVCSRTFDINNNHVCLQSLNSRSACSGDSGGPLTVRGQNGIPVQVGIVSFGSALGCERGYPQVFTRVTSYIAWIETKTGQKFS